MPAQRNSSAQLQLKVRDGFSLFHSACMFIWCANHSCLMVDGFYCSYRGTYSKRLWLFFTVKLYFKGVILMLLIDLKNEYYHM